MVHLDDYLAKFKLSQPYYLKSLALISIAYASNAMYTDNYVFAAYDAGYRCKDERFGNKTCVILGNSTDLCTEWVYDDPRSFVAEFQLACQEWKRTLVGTVHNLGNMIGLLIVGPLSDRWGRKAVLVITGVLGGACGLVRSFVTDYSAYIIFEFLEGAIGDCSSANFMLVMEIVSKEKRVLAEMICAHGYIFGAILLALAAWLCADWRIMLRVIYIPAFLFFIYIFTIDESPRWLLSKGRKDEAVTIIEKIAVKSKSKLDEDINSITFENSKELSFIGLLKNTFTSRTLLKRFLICTVWWIASTFVNFGMTITSVYLYGSKYINFSLLNIVGIPGYIMCICLLNKYKRKTVLFLSFVLAALFLIVQPFVPKNLQWLSIVLFMIGRVLSTTYFETTFIFTSEMFPTYTRNSMHALCSSLGRIGSIVAPQTPLLMAYWHGLPTLLFGAVSLVAGLVTLLAPDTNHEELPDTVLQAEALGQEKNVSTNHQGGRTMQIHN